MPRVTNAFEAVLITIRGHLVGLPILYFVLSAAFAAVYWFAWNTDPDSFIVNQEFNVFPFATLLTIAQSTDGVQSSAATEAMPFTTVTEAGATLQARSVSELTRIRLLRDDVEAAAIATNQAYQQLDGARTATYETYKKAQLEPFDTDATRFDRDIADAEAKLAAETDPTVKLSIIQAELTLKLARFETDKQKSAVQGRIAPNSELALDDAERQVFGLRTTIFELWTTIVTTCLGPLATAGITTACLRGTL
jgi:hypothetical protein